MTEGKDLRLIAVMRSEESGATVSALCENMDDARVDIRIGPLGEFVRQDDQMNGNDILLLDIDTASAEDGENLRTILKQKFPATPVLVTASDVSLDDIRNLMRLGVMDVLPQPIRQADLIIALDHASRLRPKVSDPRPADRGKVISFLQGGGGVGATALATQGGCILARQAAKDGAKVCLLDFDIQFGTAGLYLDLKSSVGLVDLIESPDRLDASFLRGAMTKHESGLEVLLCPGTVIPFDVLSPEFATNCVRLARERYDYVLVDLPTSWTSWSYAVLCESNLVLLVSEMTVGGVRQTIRQLETLAEQGVSKPFVQLVMNKYQRGWGIFGWTFGESANVDDAEKALGRKFDHLITRDFEAMSEAVNQGIQLDQIEGSTRIYNDIKNLMKDCLELLDTRAVELAAGSARQAVVEEE